MLTPICELLNYLYLESLTIKTLSRRFTGSDPQQATAWQGKAPLKLEETLSRTGPIWGAPAADGRLDREENRHTSCKYINYTAQTKVEGSRSVGSEVSRSVHGGVGHSQICF